MGCKDVTEYEVEVVKLRGWHNNMEGGSDGQIQIMI